ncbi:MAG: hypothetical protein AAFQ10_12410 [Pseudomonadota bacterium]
MSVSVKSVLVTLGIALGAMGATAATTTTASADVRGGIYIGGPGFEVGFGDYRRGPRYEDRRYRPRNFCRPGKALRKARRRGLRRAHIVRVGPRGVVVRGIKWGERVTMGFARNRHCSVRFVRSRY